MLKVIIAIWIIALSLIALGIGCYHFCHEQRGGYEKRYLQRLFENCWNGEDEDRAGAWFRVSQHLRHTKASKSLIIMADYRYKKAMQIRSKTVSVDSFGEILDQSDLDDGQAVV